MATAPSAWRDADLSAWHAAHRTPGSRVWALTPPNGRFGVWKLYPPGSPAVGPHPYHRVAPVAVTRRPRPAPEGVLADPASKARLTDWIERETGYEIEDVVEGWSEPYGPDGADREYTVYARLRYPRDAYDRGGRAGVRR